MFWMTRCVTSVMDYSAVVAMPLTSVATSTVCVTTVSIAGLPSTLPQEHRITAASSRRMETDPGLSTSSLVNAPVAVWLSPDWTCHTFY